MIIDHIFKQSVTFIFVNKAWLFLPPLDGDAIPMQLKQSPQDLRRRALKLRRGHPAVEKRPTSDLRLIVQRGIGEWTRPA